MASKEKASSAFLNPSILALCFIFIPSFSVRPSHLVFYWTQSGAHFMPNLSAFCRLCQYLLAKPRPWHELTQLTHMYKHIFLKGKAESLEFPFPRILIVFSIICRNIGVETNVGWQGEWQDQSPAWPGQVIANNKKVTHTKHFLIKISQTRSTDMSEHSNILSESRKNMILNRS